ncbi:MAG: PKD domain-containing protein [Bacteroidota bacterium]
MKQLLWTLLITISGLSSLNAQTFFYLDDVQISPTDPSPADEVMVTISGLKSTPCAFQEYTNISVNGDQANIDMCWNDTAACIQVLDPWVETYSLGMLNAGNYTLNLGGCNHSGLGNTYTFSVSGQVAPTAIFEYSADGGCAPAFVEFTNLSINADTYLWDFDAAGTSTEENPGITFTSPGNYTITLEATNSSTGETDIFMLEDAVIVYATPNITLGPDMTINDDESITLSPGPGFAEYEWSDGSTAEELVFEGSTYGPGTHNIIVMVTDFNGCLGEAIVTITVEEGPNGVFAPGKNATFLSASPNPTTRSVLITGLPEAFTPNTVQVYFSNGQNVVHPSFQRLEEGVQIDLSSLPQGLLWVVILDQDGQQLSVRIIKQ